MTELALLAVSALLGIVHIIVASHRNAPERRNALFPRAGSEPIATWAEFISTHLTLLAATDFFTVEVLTLRGLVTYYVLFFILLEGRRVEIAGIAAHPNEPWMRHIARNVTMDGCGILYGCGYLLHDRDTKNSAAFE